MRRPVLLLLVLLAFAIPFFVTSRFYLHILILCCIWGMAATSMNLIMGYTGQVNLAHGAFFGIGAYSAGLLILKGGMNFWPALVLACLITAALGFFIGILALRTKGSYFAIGTMCFNVIVTVIIDSWEELTEGARGLLGIPRPEPIPLPFGGHLPFTSMPSYYYLVLIFLLLTLLVIYRIVHSMVGRSFMAIRGNEELAESIGINAMRTKLVSFLISTVFAGLAGVLYASYIGFLSPEISDYHITFEFLIFCMIGGLGTLGGPLIGAFLLTVASELLHGVSVPRLVAYGFLLVLTIIFLPGGIMGGAQMVWRKVSGRGAR
ncbi:MAG: branched-chain amino acid ABC transporter permease [Syntrophaceae bacterium]|nr:branched-chain amino acid ABC transporter permease [Syntrophaceae bacterium]